MTDTLPTIDPRHTALLLMDYQPGILASVENAEDLLSRAVDAISLIRGAGGQVGYVRVAFEDADYDGIPPREPDGRHAGAGRPNVPCRRSGYRCP